jgi:hypothetical protein
MNAHDFGLAAPAWTATLRGFRAPRSRCQRLRLPPAEAGLPLAGLFAVIVMMDDVTRT